VQEVRTGASLSLWWDLAAVLLLLAVVLVLVVDWAPCCRAALLRASHSSQSSQPHRRQRTGRRVPTPEEHALTVHHWARPTQLIVVGACPVCAVP
jgi:hypothetical protein